MYNACKTDNAKIRMTHQFTIEVSKLKICNNTFIEVQFASRIMDPDLSLTDTKKFVKGHGVVSLLIRCYDE